MMKTITNTQTVERMNSHTDRRNQPGSFDPVGFTVVPPRRFEDLRVGETVPRPKPHTDGMRMPPLSKRFRLTITRS